MQQLKTKISCQAFPKLGQYIKQSKENRIQIDQDNSDIDDLSEISDSREMTLKYSDNISLDELTPICTQVQFLRTETNNQLITQNQNGTSVFNTPNNYCQQTTSRYETEVIQEGQYKINDQGIQKQAFEMYSPSLMDNEESQHEEQLMSTSQQFQNIETNGYENVFLQNTESQTNQNLEECNNKNQNIKNYQELYELYQQHHIDQQYLEQAIQQDEVEEEHFSPQRKVNRTPSDLLRMTQQQLSNQDNHFIQIDQDNQHFLDQMGTNLQNKNTNANFQNADYRQKIVIQSQQQFANTLNLKNLNGKSINNAQNIRQNEKNSITVQSRNPYKRDLSNKKLNSQLDSNNNCIYDSMSTTKDKQFTSRVQGLGNYLCPPPFDQLFSHTEDQRTLKNELQLQNQNNQFFNQTIDDNRYGSKLNDQQKYNLNNKSKPTAKSPPQQHYSNHELINSPEQKSQQTINDHIRSQLFKLFQNYSDTSYNSGNTRMMVSKVVKQSNVQKIMIDFNQFLNIILYIAKIRYPQLFQQSSKQALDFLINSFLMPLQNTLDLKISQLEYKASISETHTNKKLEEMLAKISLNSLNQFLRDFEICPRYVHQRACILIWNHILNTKDSYIQDENKYINGNSQNNNYKSSIIQKQRFRIGAFFTFEDFLQYLFKLAFVLSQQQIDLNQNSLKLLYLLTKLENEDAIRKYMQRNQRPYNQIIRFIPSASTLCRIFGLNGCEKYHVSDILSHLILKSNSNGAIKMSGISSRFSSQRASLASPNSSSYRDGGVLSNIKRENQEEQAVDDTLKVTKYLQEVNDELKKQRNNSRESMLRSAYSIKTKGRISSNIRSPIQRINDYEQRSVSKYSNSIVSSRASSPYRSVLIQNNKLMNFDVFKNSLFQISKILLPNGTQIDQLKFLIDEHLLNLLEKDNDKRNLQNKLLKHSLILLDSQKVIQIMSDMHNELSYFYKIYTNNTAHMNFDQFIVYCGDHGIFPQICPKSLLYKIFFMLADYSDLNHPNENQNPQTIKETDLQQSYYKTANALRTPFGNIPLKDHNNIGNSLSSRNNQHNMRQSSKESAQSSNKNHQSKTYNEVVIDIHLFVEALGIIALQKDSSTVALAAHQNSNQNQNHKPILNFQTIVQKEFTLNEDQVVHKILELIERISQSEGVRKLQQREVSHSIKGCSKDSKNILLYFKKKYKPYFIEKYGEDIYLEQACASNYVLKKNKSLEFDDVFEMISDGGEDLSLLIQKQSQLQQFNQMQYFNQNYNKA
ncbi:UNKNOWN [Stylonychia lemnae]|uniref:Uncharacterized protein n=1 Tax=Stylonychia lemnae TaxID=5949 RepID=A0A078A2G9_STYLE|nr:UNKNOWN [Stylonychia lemnae]|eukprot:CDW75728.1 UNKNOWN [Stylonychia lemnae]